ncbi:MAG: DUF1287 domain-containing protein [Nibricoccus sp.]
MKARVYVLVLFVLSIAWVCRADNPSQEAVGAKIAGAARSQIGVTTQYDPKYVSLKYPGGDVPIGTGVCSDVVVRAVRGVGLDLQKEVHEDMTAHFGDYPHKWGLKKPDRNIDHRRVPNLMTYFRRKHVGMDEKLAVATTYAPGDIVAWDLGGGLLHIGVVSDRKAGDVPLIIHNIGAGAQEEDVLFRYRVIGHYRLKATAQTSDVPAR